MPKAWLNQSLLSTSFAIKNHPCVIANKVNKFFTLWTDVWGVMLPVPCMNPIAG